MAGFSAVVRRSLQVVTAALVTLWILVVNVSGRLFGALNYFLEYNIGWRNIFA